MEIVLTAMRTLKRGKSRYFIACNWTALLTYGKIGKCWNVLYLIEKQRWISISWSGFCCPTLCCQLWK